MIIKMQRSRLLEALKRVQSGANAKTTLPILGNVKIDAGDGVVTFTTTSIDLTLSIEVDADVEEGGVTTVPMRMFLSIVSAMIEGEVEMRLEKCRMIIRGGRYVSQVGTLPADDFPRVSDEASEMVRKVKVSDLKDMLRKTAYAQSVDDTRRTLSSVLFEFSPDGLRCVATDGRRMALSETQVDFGGEGTRQCIIPSASIANLQRFVDGEGEVEIAITSNQISFALDDGKRCLFSKLVEGKYPNYAMVIPKDVKHVAIIDRELLIGAVERVSVMATRDGSSIKMTFSQGMLLVEVKGDDLCDAHDEIPIKYDGDKIEILFNPKYILDPLRASNSDEIRFELTGELRAANIKAPNERFLCALMPLRMS